MPQNSISIDTKYLQMTKNFKEPQKWTSLKYNDLQMDTCFHEVL